VWLKNFSRTRIIKPIELPPIPLLNEQQQQHHPYHIVALNSANKYLFNDLERIQLSSILHQHLIVNAIGSSHSIKKGIVVYPMLRVGIQANQRVSFRQQLLFRK
jgi:hypothetical protein